MKKFIKFIFTPIFHFFSYYITNYIIAFIPIRCLRKSWYRLLGMKIGRKTYIDMAAYMMAPWKLLVGSYTHINRKCFLDSRGKISIGNSVCISHNVSMITASHDMQSKNFLAVSAPIVIDDFVFIGANSIIQKGVEIGKGAVVCAGAVVTKNVAPFTIVGGIPAKTLGLRITDLDYKCNPHTYFF